MTKEQRVRKLVEKLRQIEDDSLKKTAELLQEGGESEPYHRFVAFEDETVNDISAEMNDLVFEAYIDGIKRDKKHDKEWLAVITFAFLVGFKSNARTRFFTDDFINKENAIGFDVNAPIPASIHDYMNEAGVNVIVDTRRVIKRIEQGSRIQFKKAQIDAITRTTNLYNQGGLTWMQAKQKALDAMAQEDITVFIDRAGRRWSLDTYAEMGIRTGINHSSIAGFDASMEHRGIDLVFCSSHFGSCPKCAPWQGRVLSRSGENSNFPAVTEAINAGLFHPNCMHVLFEYIEGHSTLRNDDSPESAERYKQTQHQRYLERGLRTWKRREAVSLTPEARRYSKAFVTKWRNTLEQFTKTNSLPRKKYRERV